MAKRIPTELRGIIARLFPTLTFSEERAPQGQNSFSFNFRLLDAEGGQFLLKAIRLGSTDLEHPEGAIEEVRASAAVRSQYFIPLLETQTSDGYTFLLFPFLEGENLAEYTARVGRSLSEDQIREIGISLLRGIADLSRFGIRHQDLKPANIFITSDGSLKILDFGSARFKKESFRGSTRTNRSHSSPEQLLASKHVNLEDLRLTCDERTDVYAAGSILHELATGEIPFPSNDAKVQGALPTEITRNDISPGFKRTLARFLSHHIRNRPTATTAISFLEQGDVEQIPVSRGGFYYNASNSLGVVQELMALDDTLVEGITITASKIPAKDADYLKNGPLVTIIDPEAYKFQAPLLINAKFKELPYYTFGKVGDVVSFENITDDDGFINSVFDYEISAGADILVTPFFFIREFNDPSWTRDAEVTARAVQIYRERSLPLPLLRGVAIAENVLQSETTRGRLLDNLTNTDTLESISGYYVLIECTQPEGLPSEDWLGAARDVCVELLATGKPVIWAQANLPAIVFADSGVGLAMGEAQSQRSFTLNENPGRGGPSSPHLYLSKLFSRIKWPGGYKVLVDQGYNRARELACNDICCDGVNFDNPTDREKAALSLHLVHQLALQFKKYSGPRGRQAEKADLETAMEIYQELRSSTNPLIYRAARNEFKPLSDAFLETWRNAFHGT